MTQEIKAGNVVEIVKKSYVVIDAILKESKDTIRGDSCYAYQFKTISKSDFVSKQENPKEKLWTIKDLSSMHGPNEVRLSNIKVLDKVKFKKETIVKYTTA